MIRDHIEVVQKYSCKIISCDPSTRTVEAMTKMGPVPISVVSYNPFFRWPKVGETWTVRQENGNWILDGIWQGDEPTKSIEGLKPGDAIIDVPGELWNSKGEKVVLYSEGTAALRPAAGTKGRIYHATDTHVYYVDTGSTWNELPYIGAWETLELTTETENGSFTPQVRIENNDVVRFRGAIKVKSGKTLVPAFENGPILAHLPSSIQTKRGHIYQAPVRFKKSTTEHVSGSILDITEGGAIRLSGGPNLESEDQIDLDGLTILLST